MKKNNKINITFLKINFITIVLFFSVYTGLSQAALTLDQYYTGPFGFNSSIEPIEDLGQSFTIGISGQLSEVDIYVKSDGVNGDLTAEIYNITSGLPVGDALASTNISSQLIGGDFSWVKIDYTTFGINVSAGDTLAILLTYDGEGTYNWSGEFARNGDYLGGTALYTYNGSPWSTLSDRDFGFKTYIGAVPIPGAVWLLGSGLIGIVGIRRKFKK